MLVLTTALEGEIGGRFEVERWMLVCGVDIKSWFDISGW